MKFTVGFQESNLVLNGSNTVHIVLTSDMAADSTHQFTFHVTLGSTQWEYTQTWTTLLPNGSKSVTIPFTVPMEWANDITVVDMNGDNGALCITMTAVYVLTLYEKQYTTTYSGYYTYLPVVVDPSVMPSVGAITYTSVDGKVPAEWDCLVQGRSVVRLTAADAAGAYGSDIYYYYFNGGTAQMQNYADVNLLTAGNVTIPVTVEDSRGRFTTADLYLAVQPYAAPSLTKVSSQRCDASGTLAEEGEYFLASGTMTGYDIDGKNPISVCVAWKKVTESEYGTAMYIDPTAGAIIPAALEAGASYDVKYTIADTFYTIDVYDYLSSTVYLLHFLKGGSGIAVGKAAEQEQLFDVALDTTMRRDLLVGGDANITGDLTLGGVSVGEVLQSIQTPMDSVFTLNTTYFPAGNVTQNQIVRSGRVVTYHFKGMLAVNDMPMTGQEYVVGSLPAGYYSTSLLPHLEGMLNGHYPCVINVSSTGQVSVVLSESGMQTVWITGTSILLD